MGSINPHQIPPSPLPSKTSTTPFWRASLHALDNHRTTPSLPQTCDILIIGGGYAGIAAAYHLLASPEAKAKFASGAPKPNVVLLEARGACSGATGRNGGHLRPSVHTRLPMLIEEFGLEKAVELCEFEDAHVSAIEEVVEREGIECEFRVTRSFDVYTDEEEAGRAKETYLRLKGEGVAKSTMEGLVWMEGEEAEKISGVKGCVGCFTFSAASLYPYKLLTSLLHITHTTGNLNLQTNTPVTSLTQSSPPTSLESSSNTWTASTPRGTITSPQIILATNAYTSALLPEYTTKIVPCKGICCHIVPSPSCTPPELVNTYCLRLYGGSHDYLIQRPDGSIIVGGGRSHFLGHRGEWYNNADDSSLIEPAKCYFDTYMQDHFTGWEESGAKVQEIWSGIMGYCSDGLPHVGEVPGRKGVWVAAGFEGHGMPVIWLTMRGVVRMMDWGSWEGSGVPRVYETSRERLESGRDDYRAKV